VAVAAVFLVLHRYGLDASGLDSDHSAYLAELLVRFLDSPYYQFMALSFLGCLGYGFVILSVLAITIAPKAPSDCRLRPGLGMRVSLILSGLPLRAIASTSGRDEFLIRGVHHATRPLRDAAALFPGLGFLGTVIGITLAIGGLEDVLKGGSPKQLFYGLRTAFDTTAIGLIAGISLGIQLLLIDAVHDRAEPSNARSSDGMHRAESDRISDADC